jgi:hypothetical protein
VRQALPSFGAPCEKIGFFIDRDARATRQFNSPDNIHPADTFLVFFHFFGLFF